MSRNPSTAKENFIRRVSRLSTKLLVASVMALIVVYAVVLTLTPRIVYSLTSKGEAATAMSFNEQVAMRMEQRFNELERFSSVVAADEELNVLLQDAMENHSKSYMANLHLYLSNIIQQDGVSSYHVLGMYLDISGDNPFYTNTVGLSDNLKEYIQEEILPEYERRGKDGMFIEPFVFSLGNTSSLFGSTFTQGFGYVRDYSKNGITGRLVIVSSYDEIVYIANDLGDYCSDYLLLTESGETVAPSVKDTHIDMEKLLGRIQYGDSYLEGYLVKDEGVYSVRKLETGGWTIVSYLNREEVLSKNRAQSYMILFSVGIFGIVAIAALVVIVNKFTRPLKEVSQQMTAIAHGDFNARVAIHSQDEIGKVGESFNIMAMKLEEMIEEILEKEKIEQTMRYSLLISQVDPHFIYNTMNTITYLAQKGRNEDVIIVNKAMIEILRDRLRIEISEVYDTVEQELNVVKQYLIIQKYRYDGMFKVCYEVDQEAMDCLIIKNILQPLVENALSHGILENKDENGELLGGCIVIKIQKKGEVMYVEVSDNGAGMSPRRLQEILAEGTNWERGSNIGIRNIRERIRYIYQTEEYLTIESQEGIGTKVALQLPVNVEEGKNGNIRVNNEW